MDSWFLAAVVGSKGNETVKADDPVRKLCFGKLKNIPIQALCIGTVLLQAYLINHHLEQGHNGDIFWWFWSIGDVIVIIIFALAFYFREWRLNRITHKREDPTGFNKGLPFASLAWLVYVILLCVRVAIIFKMDLEHHAEIGNLKLTICLTAITCVLLTAGHHHSNESLARRAAILMLIRTFTLDLLDSTDILDVLYDTAEKYEGNFPNVLEDVILAVVSINLICPSFILLSLFLDHYSSTYLSLGYKIVIAALEIFLVNVPLLLVRIYMSLRFGDLISVFLVKNVLSITFCGIEIYDCCFDRRKEKKMVRLISTNTANEEGHTEFNDDANEKFPGDSC